MVVVASVTQDAAMTAAVAAMGGPFARGSSDCWRSASKAFQSLFGVDPMGPHQYRTLSEAKRVIRDGGGRDAYCAMLAARAGLVEADPVPGMIGIVKTDGQEFNWSGGICIKPDLWAVKGKGGVSFLTDHLRCWGVPYGS
tara:strand:- start:372 stop:791 length:420 start_codon:yes stop_codon:yes gene_type:complete